MQTSIAELIRAWPTASTRLTNVIREADGAGELPFKTVGDFLCVDAHTQLQMLKLPRLGQKSYLELCSIIRHYVADRRPLVPVPEPLNYSAPLAPEEPEEPELVLAGEYPDLNQIVTSLICQLNDNQRTVVQLRFGHGFTLQEVAQQLGVTRERVRQIEAKLGRVLSVPTRRLLKTAATIIRQCLDADAINEIALVDLSNLCSCDVHQLKIFLAYARRFFQEKLENFEELDDYLYRPDVYVPAEAWEERVHAALTRTAWPFDLPNFFSTCPDVPRFWQINRLNQHYDAEICDRTVLRPPVLGTVAMCAAVTHGAGRPMHFAEVRDSINDIFHVNLTAHAVNATLGRMAEVAICGTGVYVNYSALPHTPADLQTIRDVVYDYLSQRSSFISSKLLVEELGEALSMFPETNHYLLMGIVQDDERFVTKRGNMVGLAAFDLDGTFTSLEDEVCNLVRDNGPISISEIVEKLSNRRRLCNDSGVRLILNSRPWIVEVGYRRFDTIFRALGDHSEHDRYRLAVQISLLEGPKSCYSVAQDLLSVGLEKATVQIVDALLDEIDHVRDGATIRIVDLRGEMLAYAKLTHKAIANRVHLEVADENGLTPERIVELRALDANLANEAAAQAVSEHSELSAILDEFKF